VSDREDPLTARARSFGLDLLERSSLYDQGVAVPYGDAAALSLVGLASRARGLTRAIYRLLDASEWLEVQVLLRSLLEYTLTAQWLAQDPRPRFLSWWLEDDRRFRVMEREVRALVKEPIEDIPEDLQRGRDELRDQFEKDAQAQNAPRFPKLIDMARAVDSPLAYSFVYRVLSQSGAHPYPHGLDSLIEDRPESDGVFIHGRPREEPTIEPYYLAGALLFISLREAGAVVPTVALTTELDAVEPEFLALREALDAG
jgi:hypothetical protein